MSRKPAGALMARSFSFERSLTAENPIPAGEMVSAERTLARLVAEAFAADHPELFAEKRRRVAIIGSRPKSRRDRQDQRDQGTMTTGETYARTE